MFDVRFRSIHDPDDPVADVVWITHAGGGTNALFHRWRAFQSDLPVRIQTPCMPSREELMDVSFGGDMEEMAELLASAIADQRDRDAIRTPLAVIGHSFGSVLAYRIACSLEAKKCSPRRLIVLSYPSPDQASHDQELHALSDEDLIRQVDVMFGGIPDQVREDETARKSFLPGLRLDLGLLESYRHVLSEPQAFPIVAICGTDDRAVELAQMQGWNRMTSGAFRLRAMPGDHFFPLQRMPEIVRVALWDVLPG